MYTGGRNFSSRIFRPDVKRMWGWEWFKSTVKKIFGRAENSLGRNSCNPYLNHQLWISMSMLKSNINFSYYFLTITLQFISFDSNFFCKLWFREIVVFVFVLNFLNYLTKPVLFFHTLLSNKSELYRNYLIDHPNIRFIHDRWSSAKLSNNTRPRLL
jgi:hypothetical protein